MKKVFTPLQYIYLTFLMGSVVTMLIAHLMKETVIGLFSHKSKLAQIQKQKTVATTKATKYIIKKNRPLYS